MIVDGTFTRVVEDMKNVAVCHEEALTTTLVRHKKEMESIMECSKKVEQKLFDE
jgi:hypothetical protein